MAQVTRINVKQTDGSQKQVAFLSDIKLNTVAQGDLITVTTNADSKTATVSVDNTKLSLENGNVKVNTPLEFTAQTTTPTETTGLRAVSSGGTTKLYWGSNVIEAHDPEEGYVTNADFLAHTGNTATDVKHVTDDQLAALNGIQAGDTVITDVTLDDALEPIEDDIAALKGVTDGYTTENTIKDAVDTVDAKVDAVNTKADSMLNDVIGTWTTIRDTTVKAAIEQNKAAIANDLSDITAGTSGTGVTVTIGTKSNKSQTVAVSVQDGTTAQKGIVQLADAHNASDSTKAATGSTVASAINTFDANVIGSWTDGGKYTGTVKSAIESLAAISMFRVVEELPTTGETNTIYIVKPDGQATGPYAEWIWVDNKWEKIGDTDIQLENYYKKSEIGGTWTESNTLIDYVDAADNALDGRLDTVEAKLTNLPTGKTIKQAIDEAVATEADRATGVEGTLSDLETDAKDNLVAAINEVNANADSALATASTAVQTAQGDTYISAGVSGTKLTVGVIADTELAKILSVCTITTEPEEE